MHSYQTALAMKRDDTSSEEYFIERRSRAHTTEMHKNSEESVASQGNERRTTLPNKQSNKKPVGQRNTVRAAYDSISKQRMDFLNTQKVDRNRVKMERFEKALESQFEKQNKSLERGMRSHVQGSFNKHIAGMRNGASNFVRGSGDIKFD